MRRGTRDKMKKMAEVRGRMASNSKPEGLQNLTMTATLWNRHVLKRKYSAKHNNNKGRMAERPSDPGAGPDYLELFKRFTVRLQAGWQDLPLWLAGICEGILLAFTCKDSRSAAKSSANTGYETATSSSSQSSSSPSLV